MKISWRIPFLILLLFFLCLPNIAIFGAEEEPPPEEEEPPPVVCDSGGNSWTVYFCAAEGACGGEIWGQNFWTSWWSCSDGTSGGDSGQSDPYLVTKCSPYQICAGGSSPSCICKGSCYPAPTPIPITSVDKNVFDSSGKVKLPVKLDWEDLDVSPCTVESYEYQINGGNETINGSTAASEVEIKDCRLKSNTDYTWQVRACLGSDCGAWSSPQSFSASFAPEPVAPYDADWEGSAGAEDIETPVKLDWCDVKEAGSLLMRAYIIQGDEKVCHPNLLTIKEGKEFCDPWIIRKERRSPDDLDRVVYSDLTDEDMYFFTGDASYLWEVAACIDDSGQDCKDFSQQWAFAAGKATPLETFLISPPNDPSGEKPVGLPLVLDWRKDAGINSWWYKMNSKEEFAKSSNSRSFDYPELSLDTFYQWQALSCSDYEGKKCQGSWSEIYTFKTTGRPPSLVYPTSGASNIPFPIEFDWEDVPGAKSYIISVRGSGLNVEKTLADSDFSLDYPEFPLRQETDYTWQVKTCARDDGGVCGNYSNPQSFRTFRLSAPQSPSYPGNGGTLFTDEHYLSWEKVAGAKAYQYQIKYLSLASDEKDESCSALAGKDLFLQPKTVLTTSDYTELICLGQYQWQVRSCLDTNCQETSNWSASWTFTSIEGGTGQGGLVPCGRATNNPNTPWNEREPCQVKHFVLLIKIIIDFILLRVIPVILVLLTVATGLIFYTSLGQAVTMAKVISLWKATGIGLGVVLLSWTIVNIFLKIIGYNIGIFGNWYEIKL